MWLQTFLRWLFSLIDDIIYGFIPTVYEFLLNLADVQVFSESTIQGFATRIYALLGVIMIFKLTVSMVQYVAQPDKMQSDGKKLVTNIIVSLALMIILPGIVFPVLTQLQNALLSEQVVEQLILGVGGDAKALNTKEAGGMTMSYLAFSAFFYPEDPACENNPFVEDSDGNAAVSQECGEALNKRAEDMGENAEAIKNVYVSSFLMKNHKLLIREVKDVFGTDGRGDGATNETVDLRDSHSGDSFLFHYDYFISTIVGIIILVLLLRFCIDIALRAIKLGFLQLIAPIPIISYADPKTQKNFQSYIKEYMSTYLQLFIRLAALYFAIFIISSFASPGEIYYRSTNESVGGLVKIFIIIGALMFASEVPKLLSKLLGIEAGSFSLNPFKGHALAAGVVGGAAGFVGGTAANMVAHMNQQNWDRIRGQGFKGGAKALTMNALRFTGSALSSAAGGATGGVVRGMFAGSKNNAKFGGLFKDSIARGAAGSKKIPERHGTSVVGRNVARAQDMLGMDTAYESQQKEIAFIDDFNKEADALKSTAESTFLKDSLRNVSFEYFNEDGTAVSEVGNYKVEESNVAMLKAVDTSSMSSDERENHRKELANAMARLEAIKKAGTKQVQKELIQNNGFYVTEEEKRRVEREGGTVRQELVKAAAESINNIRNFTKDQETIRYMEHANISDPSNVLNDLKDASTKLTSRRNNIITSDKYITNKNNFEYAQQNRPPFVLMSKDAMKKNKK